MENLSIEIHNSLKDKWQNLPLKNREEMASRVLNALLSGTLYPTGTEQLELAIELAEAGVAPDIIRQLTRLDIDAFEAFISSR
jgi:hypothetical protein